MQIWFFLLIGCFAASGVTPNPVVKKPSDSLTTCFAAMPQRGPSAALNPDRDIEGAGPGSAFCGGEENAVPSLSRAAAQLPQFPRLSALSPPYTPSPPNFRDCSSLNLDCPRLGDENDDHNTVKNDSSSALPSAPRQADRLPSQAVGGELPQEKVQWGALLKHEFIFLSVMHSYRVATEPGTLQGIEKSTFGGYFKALGALHGWSDGDTYYETYLGHPIQGAVSSFMWVHHDKERYRNVEFGKSRDYWMSRLRAYGWSYAEIAQFKVGLLSEATIGQIDRYCCAYGFNDHIITSNGGMVWLVGEDALDKYLIRRIEDHTNNVFLRAAARTWLNPVQGMANLMSLEWPWYRENRGPLREYHGDLYPRVQEPAQTEFPVVPKFEMAAAVPELMRFGNLSCWGGGGVAGFRVTDSWQWSLEVSGCTLGESLPTNWSGDQLSWTTGPQWIRHSESRWSPHAHFRVGGQKITEKQVDPQVLSWVGGPPPLTDGENSEGQKHWESTGFSMSMGGGLDMRVTRAFAWRFANFDYVRSWLGQLNGVNFDHGFRLSMGVVLRVGTW
jgi:hypothetical protein